MATENVVEEKKEEKFVEKWFNPADDPENKVVRFPERFCAALADTGFETLRKWLEKNAPPETKKLLDAIDLLRMAEYNNAYCSMINGELEDSLISESVRDAAWAINKLGGNFYSAWGELGPDK